MVAPDLDVPGIRASIEINQYINIFFWLYFQALKVVFNFLFSTMIIIIPPSTSEITTTKGLNKFALIP